MSNPDPIKTLLASLHKELAEKLLAKLRDPAHTAADLNVIRQFLKDNGIDSSAKVSKPLQNMKDELPFVQEEQRKLDPGLPPLN